MITDTETIKKSEANLNTILNHADSGYVLYDSELRIIAYNAQAQKLSHLLYAKKLVEGKHLLSYFPEDRHRDLLAITQNVINGIETCYEVCFKDRDAETWIEVKWLTVKNVENKNWGFILVSKNITESKLAAIKLEKITNDLLRRNKALEQFANIISHNLRAPVANIISLAQMIGEAKNNNEKDELLDFILSSSRVLNTVIEDIHQILDVRQHIHEAKEKIYFAQLLKDIQISIAGLILKENVIIHCDFESAPYIYNIRSFLHSIYYNLILNSIKYRRAESIPIIYLAAKKCKNALELTFKDNGKGIDMIKNGDKLFGLYKRFDPTTEGSGLGLFMIKSQIEELGGTITVESELGKGTTFIINLPI